jgi:hypothetical protein
MPVSGLEFATGPFQDVRYLIEQVDILYREQIVPRGGPDRWQAAADRIIAHRKWEPALPSIRANLYPILKELDVFFVPKHIQPGPCFVFPHWDTTGEPVRGKIRPVGWDLVMRDMKSGTDTIAKYGLLGLKHEFKGPTWMGNPDRVLELIMKLKFVILVEGPFDVIACRLLFPDLPVMSSGTKSLNEQHLTYLKVLGVETVVLLFDNETGKQAGDYGAGKRAAIGASRTIAAMGMQPVIQMCPSKNDPSACLEDHFSTTALQRVLEKYVGVI